MIAVTIGVPIEALIGELRQGLLGPLRQMWMTRAKAQLAKCSRAPSAR
jgi:hypothetical protein